MKKKLTFKITVYHYYKDTINQTDYTYGEIYDDSIKLGEIIDDICINKIHISTSKNNVIIETNELLWDKYFKNLYSLIDERKTSEYLKYKICDLCNQFDIQNKIINISINPPMGGYVGRNKGIHYFFHTNEKDLHHIPHIHVKSGKITFRVDLKSLKIMDKTIFKNPKKNKLALKMIKLNQKELIDYWNKVVIKGEKIKFKMYLPY